MQRATPPQPVRRYEAGKKRPRSRVVERPKHPGELDEATLEGIVEQQFPLPRRRKIRRRRAARQVEPSLQADAPVETAPATLETEQIEKIGEAAELTVTAEEVEALWSQELLDLIQNTAAAFAEAAIHPPVAPSLVQALEAASTADADTAAIEAQAAAAPTESIPTGTTEVPTMSSEPNESPTELGADAPTPAADAATNTAQSEETSTETSEVTATAAPETAATETAADGAPSESPADATEESEDPAEPAADEDATAREGSEDVIDFDQLAREAEGVLSEVSAFAEPMSDNEPAPADEPSNLDPFTDEGTNVPTADDAAPALQFEPLAEPSPATMPDPLAAAVATAPQVASPGPIVPTVVALNAEDSLALRQIRTDVQALEGQQKDLVSSIETVRQDVRETKIDTAANTKATVEALASLRTMQGRLVAESRARAKAMASPVRTPMVLGVAVIAISWGVAYYFKTGDLKLALAGVVAANLLGCLALFARR